MQFNAMVTTPGSIYMYLGFEFTSPKLFLVFLYMYQEEIVTEGNYFFEDYSLV